MMKGLPVSDKECLGKMGIGELEDLLKKVGEG